MVPASHMQDIPGPFRKDRYWPRKFTEGQNVNPEILNRPYISELQAVWKKSDDDGDENEGDIANGVEGGLDEAENPLNKEDSCVARIFMRGRWHQESSEMLEADNEMAAVENFSGHIHFKDLQKPDAAETEPLALFEESSQIGARRKGRGMLTSGQLYRALQDKRFAVEIFRGALGQRGEIRKFRPDANQRRLYIHNITAHATAALMATTSGHEAPAVRDLLHLHLNREAAVRVQIPPRGFQTFTFILSIPWYTKGPRHLPDARQLNKKPLRKALTIPILGKSGRTSAAADDFGGELHEAQTTIVLTGIDEQRWSRATLVDSTRVTETVKHYYAEQQPDEPRLQELQPDDPRLDFLWVWDRYIAKVHEEWNSIVGCFERTVTGMCFEDSSMFENRQPDVKKLRDSSIFESRQPDVQKLRDSVMKKAQLASWLVPLHLTLSGIVDAWKQFQNSDIKYFQDDAIESEAAARKIDALHAIEGNYSRLQLTREKLDKLIKTLKGDPLNGVLVAVRSEQSVEAGDTARRLTNANMCFLPFMLAFTCFSMSSPVLPFAPNSQSLAYTLATFTAATFLLVNFLDAISDWLRLKSTMASDVWGLVREYVWGLVREYVRGVVFKYSRSPRGQRQHDSESGNGWAAEQGS